MQSGLFNTVSDLQLVLGCRDRSAGVSDEGPCPSNLKQKEKCQPEVSRLTILNKHLRSNTKTKLPFMKLLCLQV